MPPVGGNLLAALPKSQIEPFDKIVRRYPQLLSGLTTLSKAVSRGSSARLPEVHYAENRGWQCCPTRFCISWNRRSKVWQHCQALLHTTRGMDFPIKYRFWQYCQKRDGSEKYEQTITSHLRPHERQGLRTAEEKERGCRTVRDRKSVV